jgi:hypothetical protein
MRVFLAALMGLGAACLAAPATAQDHLLSASAAAELREMCQADNGRLWGADLCGPLMVVDPATRRVWTSQRDAAGLLQPAGAGWIGGLPVGVPVANTTIEWAGVRWIQLLAPLPADPTHRRVLLAHEAWHRVQLAIGLAAQPSDCAHLERERARTLMRLEFRALGTALRSSGRGRREAATAALLFRAARLSEFPGAAGQEASPTIPRCTPRARSTATTARMRLRDRMRTRAAPPMACCSTTCAPLGGANLGAMRRPTCWRLRCSRA